MFLLEIFREEIFMTHFIVSFLLIVGMLFLIVSLFWKGREKDFLRVGGVAFVTLLAISANQTAVYLLSVFLIATFITKLDFLENLAALFWGRKEFWEYKLATANPQEKNEKTNSEVKEVIEENGGQDPKRTVSSVKDRYIQFENDVIEALKQQNTFVSIKSNVKLTIGTQHFLFDAVASTIDAEYVIEVKMVHTYGVVTKAINQIETYIEAINQYYSKVFWHRRKVKGILILPSTTRVGDFLGDVAILKFDFHNKTFTNITEIKKWVS